MPFCIFQFPSEQPHRPDKIGVLAVKATRIIFLAKMKAVTFHPVIARSLIFALNTALISK